MGPRTFLHDFRIHLPAHRGTHEYNLQWLAAAHARSEATRRADPGFDREAFRRQMERHLRRFGASPQALGWRRSDISEFLDERFEEKTLFPLDRKPEGAPMGERMDAYAAMAGRAFEGLFPPEEEAPEELLHVTCTGYAAPSPAQILAEARGWGEKTRFTQIYHMGCYAALPACRVAAGLAAAGASRCDLVHTEICTLHLNPSRHDPEQLVVQSLFSDGYIRYGLSPEAPQQGAGFEILGFAEMLVPDSREDIGWSPGESGMRMTLSRHVPEKVGAVLDAFLDRLARACGLQRGALREAVYAVHPGGPRILDKAAEWLGLERWQLAASRDVLFHRGNMSSATLPHIWAQMLEDGRSQPGMPVVSLAFGPGLTVYGSVMRLVVPRP